MKEPAVYQITARRMLRFYTETDGKLDNVPEEAAARLTVTPASREKLGELITALGEKIKAARNEDDEAWQELLAIDDDRVVPIFLKGAGERKLFTPNAMRSKAWLNSKRMRRSKDSSEEWPLPRSATFLLARQSPPLCGGLPLGKPACRRSPPAARSETR